jgi:uncharacterized protein (TIRG00374 family)
MKVKRIVITVAVVVALLALAYLQFRTWKRFDWGTFWDETSRANPWKILAGVGLIYLGYLFRALRWKIFLRPVKKTSAIGLLRPTMIGFAGLAILGRPGDLMRAYLISRKENLSLPSQIAVLTVERIFDMGCFALLLILDIAFAPWLRHLPYFVDHPSAFTNFRIGGYLLFGLVLVFAGIIFLVWRNGEAVANFLERIFRPIAPRFAEKLCHKTRTFGRGLHTLHDFGSFLQIFALSIVLWLSIAYAYVQVTHAYPQPLQHMVLSYVLLLMSASIAGSILQLPVVGGGSQLGTIGVLTAVFAIKPELATSCGIMLWLVTFVAVVPVGLALARAEHVSLIKASEESHQITEEAGILEP